MDNFVGYRCSICGNESGPYDVDYVCPLDGGNLDVILDYEAIRKKYRVEDITCRQDFSLWRYLPLLPVADPGGEGTPLRMAGWTPLYSPLAIMKKYNLRNLWIKDEGRNPTASFKDRASSVVVARARQINAKVIVTASTGNAGAALAGMAAAVGQPAVIFAPRTAPPAKVAQLLIYGAQVILVDGNYDQAFDLTIEAAQEFGWYCRNTGYNPFTVEGKKTAALEIWENIMTKVPVSVGTKVPVSVGTKVPVSVEIDRGAAPEPLAVFVSVGDGNIISGLHKGFKDLQALGWLERIPRLFGVQAEGSAAVTNAFLAHTEFIQPVSAHTIADSISVDLPRDGVRAVRAAVQTGGAYLTVSDEAILKAIAELGQVGIFAEPAGATAYAGMQAALSRGMIDPDDPIVVINTGSGLKDTRAAMQAVKEAPVIEPTLAALKKYMAQ